MGQAEHHGGVGPRARREVQRPVLGELDPARIDRHQPHPAQHRLLDPRADDGMALGGVGADDHGRVGVVEVGERARRARQPQRLAHRERGGRVTHARAVVDVVGPHRGAHQTGHRVAVLVRGPRGGEPGDRVGPVVGLDPPSSDAIRPIASSQVAGRKPSASRISGVVRRSRRFENWWANRPLRQVWPRSRVRRAPG